MARKQAEMLEKIRDFGELIVRLEAYRENIIHSSTWPVFGIVMSSGTLIIWVIYLMSAEKMLKEKDFIDFRKVLTLKGPRTVIFLTDRGYKKYQEELKKVNILLRTLTSIREISD